MNWKRRRPTKPNRARLADALDQQDQLRPVRRYRTETQQVYQLKVTLKDIRPPIWRRLLVPDFTLDDLHETIQIAMGWETYHLYSFEIGTKQYTHPQMDEGELNMEDSTATMLSNVLYKAKQKLIYTYDFGDNWKHEIVVEKIEQPEAVQRLPIVVKGVRACPPEDVGGWWGYAEYLEAMANPRHERHEEFMGWRGPFNPKAFDADAANETLRKVFR